MGGPVGGPTILVVGPDGMRQATMDEIAAGLLIRMAAAEARLALLEAKPEEVAHFTASARTPAMLAPGSATLRLTGLVPARAGDAIKAGTPVYAAAKLPAGLNIASSTAPEDGVVEVQLTATLAVTTSSAPLAWAISALR